ncbi:MAG TPA: PepSY-associated TM helix domain-containing protein, partial [Polyangiales bacterium]|nr:PepSY-associated TM helix domain-containing protein [Polyangiales bacterium]
MAVFLTVAGLTGCLLAFYTDLDAALNPELFRVHPPSPGAPLLDPLVVREKLLAQLPPGTEVQGVMLRLKPDRSVNYWIDERETFVDPYTGALLGSRKFGKLSEGKKNVMTFLYEFHFTLALGEVGSWLFGVVALLWTFDCFVGAYLTLPPARARQAGAKRKSWLSRWLPAWLLKTNKLFTLVFTWHRASGLWVWGFLLVFAWSGVAL